MLWRHVYRYCIWTGFASSPTPVPLLPATYQSTLHTVRTSYLMRHVQVRSCGQTVLVPKLVKWYLQDFGLDRAAERRPEDLEIGDILNYIGAHLPAGSSTHAYVQSATTASASFDVFNFAPICTFADTLGAGDSQVTCKSVPWRAVGDVLPRRNLPAGEGDSRALWLLRAGVIMLPPSMFY